jgi:hypothetical protein
MSTSTSRERATELLTHYLKLPWEAAGLTWTYEHTNEVQEIVDLLAGLVRDEIQKHAENAPHLYPDGSAS